MSVMNRLFGSTPRREQREQTAAHAPRNDEPRTLSETLELLEKRSDHITRLVTKETEAARAHHAAGRKRQALECIKRKNLHEKEMEQLGVKKLNLMQTEQTLQALKFNSIVLSTQLDGAAAIEREIKRSGNAERVEEILDRADDALTDASEVLGSSSRAIGSAAGIDDDELLAELEQLEMDALAADLSAVTTTEEVEPVFANVPRMAPLAQPSTAAREREEAELRSLSASMQLEKPMPMAMTAMCH